MGPQPAFYAIGNCGVENRASAQVTYEPAIKYL